MIPYLQDPDVTLYHGDALDVLRELPDESVHCIATSPPFYALRDYGTGRWEGGDAECDHQMSNQRWRDRGESLAAYVRSDTGKATGGAKKTRETIGETYRSVCGKCGARRVDRQIGLEETPDAWAAALVAVFREARRVLRKDGTLWVECGDSYVSGQGGRQSEVGEMPARPLILDSIDDIGRDDVDTGSWRSGATSKLTPARGTTDLKPKDLLGQPWLLAFALRADGWWLRGCNIWAKPNAMPESAKDRCTTAHSYVFQLSKSARYFFDAEALREPLMESTLQRGYTASKFANGRGQKAEANADRGDAGEPWNVPTGSHPRSVWTIPTQGYPEAHFATWPEALARRIILAGCPESVCSVCGKARVRITETEVVTVQATNSDNPQDPAGRRRPHKTVPMKGNYRASTHTLGYTDCGHNAYQPGVILDPFVGSGTTCFVARKLGRRSIGIDLSAEYLDLAAKRLQQQSLFA